MSSRTEKAGGQERRRRTWALCRFSQKILIERNGRRPAERFFRDSGCSFVMVCCKEDSLSSFSQELKRSSEFELLDFRSSPPCSPLSLSSLLPNSLPRSHLFFLSLLSPPQKKWRPNRWPLSSLLPSLPPLLPALNSRPLLPPPPPPRPLPPLLLERGRPTPRRILSLLSSRVDSTWRRRSL